MKISVAVVLVNWNNWRYTLACARSLQKMRSNHRMKIVVVDNGSTDASIQEIQKASAGISLVPLGENKGFTGGNNAGMTFAYDSFGADYVWVLNNDTTVDDHALDELVRTHQQRQGICGSKIYFRAGKEFHLKRYAPKDRGKVLWYAGGSIDWENVYASHRGVDEVDCGQFDVEQQTDFVTGCSMLIHRSIAEKVGFFDERYYLYFEDVDLCMRAKQKGFSSWYAPRSVVWHENAGSSGGPGSGLHEYYQTRNRLLFGMQYAPVRTRFALAREAVHQMTGHNHYRRKAVMDWLTGRFGKGTGL